jgi:hypothetical protein
LSQSPLKKKIQESPYKEQEVKVVEIQSVSEQQKLLKQVDELDHAIKLKETFPNKWLQEIHGKEKSITVENQSFMDDKKESVSSQTLQISKPIAASQQIQVKVNEDKKVSEKYIFSAVFSFQNIQNGRVRNMAESSLPKYDFGKCSVPTSGLDFIENELIVSGHRKSGFSVSGAAFKPPSTNNWDCSSCMVSNKQDAQKCISCESDKPGTKSTKSAVESLKMPAPPASVMPSFDWAAAGNSFKPPLTNNWECSSCMVSNKQDAQKCISCESDKPGSKKLASAEGGESLKMPLAPSTGVSTFNWGASLKSSSPHSTAEGSAFSALGSTTSSQQSGFTFGSFSAAPSAFNVGFSFGNTQTNQTGFTFGASAAPKDASDNKDAKSQ